MRSVPTPPPAGLASDTAAGAAGPTTLLDLLDRLPSGPLHRRIVIALSTIFFFELADLNTFSYAAPALTKHRGFTLDDIAQITSGGFVGMAVGALVGGRIADRFGRRRSLIASVCWFSIFSLLTATVSTTQLLLTMRFLTGFGLSAMTVIAISYLSEIVAPSRRGHMQALTLGVGLLGIPAAAFIARGVIPLGTETWRLVFIFGGLGLLALPLLAALPETPRWLVEHRRLDDARAVALRLGVPEQLLETVSFAPATKSEWKSLHALTSLFRGRLAGRTVVMLVTWAFSMLGFYAFAAWVPSLLAAHGYSLTKSLTFSAITTLGAVPGALLALPITERFSRKWLMAITSLLIAACGTAYGLSTSGSMIIVFGLLVAALGQTFVAFLYAYTPEVFPTTLRSTGSGIGYSAGRVANVVGPLAIPVVYTGAGYAAVFLLLAACWVIAGVTVAVAGPETRGTRLEEV
jgi:putative MFS transporter